MAYKLFRTELSWQLMCSRLSWCSGLSRLLRLNAQRRHRKRDRARPIAKVWPFFGMLNS